MVASSDNVPIAFGLVCMSGLSTAIGSAVVFFPSLVSMVNKRTLAGSLALSAGVMVYVSFVEIFQTSKTSFVMDGHGSGGSFFYSTMCFFAGVLFMVIANMMVHALSSAGHHHHHDLGNQTGEPCEESSCKDQSTSHHPAGDREIPPCPCHSNDPTVDLENLYNMAREIEGQGVEKWAGIQKNRDCGSAHECDECQSHSLEEASLASETEHEEASTLAVNQKKLMVTSINTAVAIAFHNFPEGLATFVSALADPGVGAVLAVAIAIHNIPEGICVSLPIYYATGNRVKAFFWGVLSGLSEILAALLGWLVLADRFSNTLFGVLFGIVAGMMVIISIKELLPTAHRYDPDDTLTSTCFIIGMGIMALSLVLFTA